MCFFVIPHTPKQTISGTAAYLTIPQDTSNEKVKSWPKFTAINPKCYQQRHGLISPHWLEASPNNPRHGGGGDGGGGGGGGGLLFPH